MQGEPRRQVEVFEEDGGPHVYYPFCIVLAICFSSFFHAETKRQAFAEGAGSSFDGSSGVDAEDIINIPQIGYGSFQLFPDQNTYGPDDPSLPAFNNTVQTGLSWIQSHAELGQLYDFRIYILLFLILYLPRFNKPVALTGFGLVTQNNAPDFVPFNSTQAPFGPDPRMSNILSLHKMLIISSCVQPLQPQRRLQLQLQPRRPLVSPIHKEMMPMPNGCKV